MSQLISILDENGNIDASRLAKEVKASLEFDIRYKQTDNMKKRAIRSAASYDEFKNMVAAAHLKKLSKKEIESLSQVKQGWQKPGHSIQKKTASEAALIIEKEKEQLNLMKNNDSLILDPLAPKVISSLASNEEEVGQRSTTATVLSQKKKASKKEKKDNAVNKPKSSLELERDLRRIRSDSDKLKYLELVGREECLNLLQSSAEIDFFEEVLRILIVSQESKVEAGCNAEAGVPNSDILAWLEGIAKIDKFTNFIKYANKETMGKIAEYLRARQESSDAVAPASWMTFYLR